MYEALQQPKEPLKISWYCLANSATPLSRSEERTTMHGGPIDTVLFVHGYSVADLRSFNQLPALLQADGISPANIFMAGWVSLDDRVSCDDLAAALEVRISQLESSYNLDLTRTVLIAHSTGAIVARRWILNRRAKKAADPTIRTLSHFISCAGANHGSTMAQLGQSQLAYVFRNVTQGRSVGKRVLENLDYGSTFLRQLNRNWLDAWNNPQDPLYVDTFCFSMGGTNHSFWQNHLTWQSREFGSDGTVRISGANLNYRWISIPGGDPASPYKLETLSQRTPHLVVETPLKQYSHTSQSAPDTQNLVLGATNVVGSIIHGFGNEPDRLSSQTFGIVEGVASAAERPYTAIRQAMAVQDVPSYAALATAWAQETGAWTAANPDGVNSTVVVAIEDGTGAIVDDSLVLLRDSGGTIASVSASILNNQPIRNGVSPSVASFYVNFQAFEAVHGHSVHVEALTDTPYMTYGNAIDGPISGGTDHVIAPNEFTYVDVTMDRATIDTVAFAQLSNPNFAALLQLAFPPFDEPGWI